MTVQRYFPLKPFPMRLQFEDDLVTEQDLRRLYVLRRRAFRATPILQADGWDVWFTGHGLTAEHPDLTTRAEAEARLSQLGLGRGIMFRSAG